MFKCLPLFWLLIFSSSLSDFEDVLDGPALPVELLHAVVGDVIGQYLHEWIERTTTLNPVGHDQIHSSSPYGRLELWRPVAELASVFDRARFLEFWRPIAELASVSVTFHALVHDTVIRAFGLDTRRFDLPLTMEM